MGTSQILEALQRVEMKLDMSISSSASQMHTEPALSRFQSSQRSLLAETPSTTLQSQSRSQSESGQESREESSRGRLPHLTIPHKIML